MAERYIRVFSQQERLYCPGAPVIIEAGALLKDNETGKIIAQVKFKNISSQNIRALTVRISAWDVSGNVVTGVDNFQYLDLNVYRDGTFGAKTPIALPDAVARSFTCECRSAVFTNGDSWVCKENAQWVALPVPAPLSKKIGNGLTEQYRRDTNSKAEYVVTDYEDLWYCTCGTVNRSQETLCHYCRSKKAALLAALNLDTLRANKKNYDDVVAARQAEIEAERQKRNQKNKKIAIITTTIVCAIIAFIIVLNTVIMPNSKYNDAIALMDAGKYTEAISAFEALDGYKDSINKIEECNVNIYGEEVWNKVKSVNIGNTYRFGSYEQDNNKSNGQEDIEWLVLAKEGTKILVISKYALDCQQYNTTMYTDVTWETCTLRKWLNSNFLGSAFTADEKAMIPTVTVSADKNPGYSTNPGNATQDQVFLLSIPEVNKYFNSDSARQCKPTDYAVANGALENDSGNCWWWLRSPGYTQGSAATVYDDGDVDEYGSYVFRARDAVRPALWIDLNS